jgi:hypothetical protein
LFGFGFADALDELLELLGEMAGCGGHDWRVRRVWEWVDYDGIYLLMNFDMIWRLKN